MYKKNGDTNLLMPALDALYSAFNLNNIHDTNIYVQFRGNRNTHRIENNSGSLIENIKIHAELREHHKHIHTLQYTY